MPIPDSEEEGKKGGKKNLRLKEREKDNPVPYSAGWRSSAISLVPLHGDRGRQLF